MPLKMEKLLKSSKNEHVWAHNFLIRASIFLKFCMHVEIFMQVFLYSYIIYVVLILLHIHWKSKFWEKSHIKGNNSYKYFLIFLKFCMHSLFIILIIFAIYSYYLLSIVFKINAFENGKITEIVKKMSTFGPVTFL